MATSILVKFNGEIKSVKKHCRDLNISYQAVRNRHKKTGESYEKCIEYYQNNDVKGKIRFNNKIASIEEHCKDLGINPTTFYRRIAKTGESYLECLEYYLLHGAKGPLKVFIEGVECALVDYCKQHGINPKSVRLYKYKHPELSYEDILLLYVNGDIVANETYKLEYNGEIISLKQYCKLKGISYSKVLNTKNKYNISIDEAIKLVENNEIKNECINYVNWQGKLITIKEFSELINIPYGTIVAYKNKHKISYEQAFLELSQRRKTKDKRLRCIWRQMMDRCYNPKNHMYHRYGGRGITVQEYWHDYFNFENDMYESYIQHVKEYGEKETTIDRYPNNDGNYEIDNVRWATAKEQARNRCTSLILKNGELARDFCDKNNINIDWVYNRMSKHNMTVDNALEDVLNSPIKEKHNTKHILPCNNSLRHHCIQNKYTYETILEYIRQYNLSPDEALARYLKNRKKKNK